MKKALSVFSRQQHFAGRRSAGRRVLLGLAGLYLVVFGCGARALSLGPDEFVAARAVACILAQDALGYLAEDDFNALLDGALEDFDDSQGDVIYAKALGYFDGLMFGIPAGDELLVSERLRAFNQSQDCSGLVVSNYRL